MKKLNPAYMERLRSITNRSPYFSLISMEIIEFGLDFSVIAIDLAEKHLQPFGAIHGGVFASLIDAAAFWAVFGGIEDPEAGMTSIDLKLNFLAPISAGKLIARGRRVKLGKTLGYAEVEVVDGGGRILAHGTSTLMVLPGKKLPADPPLPPKFLD